MTTNLTLGTADIAVLIILLILFVLGVRIAVGFFHDQK
jgi:hypothetical protein